MIQAVQRRFHQRETPRAGILLRSNLDAVLLAVQKRTAARCGVQLDRVACTIGRLCMAHDLPFSYAVSELITVDKERIPIPRTTQHAVQRRL